MPHPKGSPAAIQLDVVAKSPRIWRRCRALHDRPTDLRRLPSGFHQVGHTVL